MYELWEYIKTYEVVKAIHNASLDIVRIQEVKRLGESNTFIKVEETEHRVIAKEIKLKKSLVWAS